MKIAISGSTGFIGKHLTVFFSDRGDEVVSLRHSLFQQESDDGLKEALYGCDVVINLAGATINRRWTKSAKEKILTSRVDATRKLVALINEMEVKPSLFISASAVGIYPTEGIYTENGIEGTGFLSQVCLRWEEEAQRLSTDVRLAIIRLGVVLAADGGALPKMLIPFRLFVGGKIASGNQGFSWIHIEDVINAILFVITHPDLSGVVNFVSPQPIINKTFTHVVAKILGRPAWMTIPRFVFRLLYGEGEVLVTKGQYVYPSRLLSAGYSFRYSDIRMALQSLLF